MSNFTDFDLDKNILCTLKEIGYEKPTCIQELAIPEILKGSDIIASAQTGTGKTAAFMLPALTQLMQLPKQQGLGTSILVLVPTRELAMQVTTEVEKYSKQLSSIKTVCIYGGIPYSIQRKALARPYHVLVATPGRLIDHMQQGHITLSKLRLLILDEADCMLDMGFIDAVKQIAAATPQTRQTLLFSATLNKRVLTISKSLQKDPYEICVKPTLSTKNNIEQRLYYADNYNHKMRLLAHILDNTAKNQAIVFTSTRRQANEISDSLRKNGHLSAALHGDMNQRQRTGTIDKLRGGRIHVLVATDVAARGIDIPSLSLVVNLDLPYQPQDYIHRIGRTGRAGTKGLAISLATYQEKSILSAIIKFTKSPIEVHTIEGLAPKTETHKKATARQKTPVRKRYVTSNRKYDKLKN